MKREIKFRQRILKEDGTFKCFFYWGFIDGDFISPAHQFGHLSTAEESDQFTGRLDKNRKEIYEGDIIKTPHFTDTEEHCLFHYVRWDNEFNAFTVINRYNTVTDLKINGNTFLYVCAKESIFEVYGNIHENPEF